MRARFEAANVPLDVNDPAYEQIVKTVVVLHARTGQLTGELLRAATEIGRLKQQAAQIHAEYVDALATVHTAEQQFLVDEKRRNELTDRAEEEAEHSEAGVHYVYYARRGSLVKIGTSSDIYRRMAEILPDEVMAVEPGSYALESKMHLQFRHLRALSRGQREWFRLEQELRDHITGVRDFHGNPPVGLPTLPPSH
jgi:hypothetical protein